MYSNYQAGGEHCPSMTSAAAPPSAICSAPRKISFVALLVLISMLLGVNISLQHVPLQMPERASGNVCVVLDTQ